ncbi:MAG: IS66 family transposase [Planctomycetota bacterium]
MASQRFCCELKFCHGYGVGLCVTDRALRAEVEGLRRELANSRSIIAGRDALLADRDARIAQLAADVATLQKAVVTLMAQRRGGGLHVPKGQGLLFGDGMPKDSAAEVPSAEPGPAASEDDSDDADEDDSPPRQSRAKGSKRTPGKIDTTGLPRTREEHDLPEDQRIDPVSGKPLVPIGEKVSEELDYQRGQLRVKEHVQILYGLPPEETAHREMAPKAASLPPKPFDNCIASASLLAWILVQKFCNHLPLYRQQRIFERDGLRLSRKTQCDWSLASAGLLEPIVECLMRRIRAGPVLQLDDTPVKCQGGRGEPHFQARLWVFVNPEVSGAVYRFTPGRDSASLANLLGNFEGWLIGDGYGGNRAAAKKVVAAELSPDIRIGGCWAHVTRKFRDAATEAKGTSKLFRTLIQQLYEIEHEADAARLSCDARTELRQRRSTPIVLTIFQHAWRLGGQFSDAGAMAKAIGYVRNQHRELCRFLDDGRIPLDNNACERAIRPIAIGRRNWLFAGSMRGGRAAASVFSLVESCRLVGVDPVDYLADVLVRVGSHPASRIEDLVPQNWVRLFGKMPAAEAVSA